MAELLVQGTGQGAVSAVAGVGRSLLDLVGRAGDDERRPYLPRRRSPKGRGASAGAPGPRPSPAPGGCPAGPVAVAERSVGLRLKHHVEGPFRSPANPTDACIL